MLKKANCRWYTAETEQTELCHKRLLDAMVFFRIKKKLVFDAMVGKKFRTEFRTDAPVDAMLVFCIKKHSYRRYAGFKKCAATLPKHKKNGVPSGSRYIFLCKIGDDLLKLLKKKTFWNTPHHGMPSRIIKK